MSTKFRSLTVRLPEELLRRLDDVHRSLAEQVPGATRNDAVCLALAKGLDSIETEAGALAPDDHAWMRADLSRLGEFEPYDFGDKDADALGAPVEHLPNGSFVVEARR